MKYLAIWIFIGLICFGGLWSSGAPMQPGQAAFMAYTFWVIMSALFTGACASLSQQPTKSTNGGSS